MLVAGKMSAKAKEAKRLLDTADWAGAAPALQQVASGATGDDPGNRANAGYWLGIAYYRRGLLRASAQVLSQVAATTPHPRNADAPVWLARLAEAQVPAGELFGSLGTSAADSLARLTGADKKEAHDALAFLSARKLYVTQSYDKAIEVLATIPKESPWFVAGLQLEADCHIRLRKSVPAVKALDRALARLDETPASPAASRARDFTHYSLGVVYLTASVRHNNGELTVDASQMSMADKMLLRVATDSPFGTRAAEARALLMLLAGQADKGIAGLDALKPPDPTTVDLRGVMLLSLGRTAELTAVPSRLAPVAQELEKVVTLYCDRAQRGPFAQLLRDSNRNAGFAPEVLPIVQSMLADPRAAQLLEELSAIEAERASISSKLGAAGKGNKPTPLDPELVRYTESTLDQASAAVAQQLALVGLQGLMTAHQRLLDAWDLSVRVGDASDARKQALDKLIASYLISGDLVDALVAMIPAQRASKAPSN